MKIVIDWGVSPFFGWGVYGLNLAIEWSKRSDIIGAAADPPTVGELDPLTRRRIKPFVLRSGRGIPHDALHLHALGNELQPDSATAPIGVIFFEQPLSKDAIERARRYELIIAGSSWNAEVLRSYGLDNVTTILQGVDHSLFHPAPRRGLFPGKFVVFSGGKAEPRKGQDLVVKAFRVFAQKHPEALLLTAWHSPWAHLKEGMDLDLGGLDVIDVGAVPNTAMAPIYREADVALFPNRAEGGTNLVAMECLACGVPTILSANTGHRDIMHAEGAIALRHQRCAQGQWTEWGESEIDEIVAALEDAHEAWRDYDRLPSGKLPGLTWCKTSDELIAAIRPFAKETMNGGRDQAAAATAAAS